MDFDDYCTPLRSLIPLKDMNQSTPSFYQFELVSGMIPSLGKKKNEMLLMT